MISKETHYRKLVNKLWRLTSSKVHREGGVQKDGYRWLVHQFTKKGLNISRIVSSSIRHDPVGAPMTWMSIAKNSFERFGDFDPAKFGQLKELARAADPILTAPPDASAREKQLHDAQPHLTPEERQELNDLRNMREQGYAQQAYTSALDPVSPETTRSDAVVDSLPIAVDPYLQEQAQRHFRPEQAFAEPAPEVPEQPAYSPMYLNMVEAGLIQMGDPLPEDPPEGWSPDMVEEDEPEEVLGAAPEPDASEVRVLNDFDKKTQ